MQLAKPMLAATRSHYQRRYPAAWQLQLLYCSLTCYTWRQNSHSKTSDGGCTMYQDIDGQAMLWQNCVTLTYWQQIECKYLHSQTDTWFCTQWLYRCAVKQVLSMQTYILDGGVDRVFCIVIWLCTEGRDVRGHWLCSPSNGRFFLLDKPCHLQNQWKGFDG